MTAAAGHAAQGLTQYLSVLPSGSVSSPHLRGRAGGGRALIHLLSGAPAPAAFPAQAPVAIGDLGAPSGLAQLSVPLCTSLSLHISNSVHLCPVWGRSQRDSWRGKQKRRETGPPPSRDPHPSDQFSGTSYICLPSLLTWWGMGGRGRCVCAKYISLVGLLKSVTLALPLISAGETEGWGSESGRAGTGAELGRG